MSGELTHGPWGAGQDSEALRAQTPPPSVCSPIARGHRRLWGLPGPRGAQRVWEENHAEEPIWARGQSPRPQASLPALPSSSHVLCQREPRGLSAPPPPCTLCVWPGHGPHTPPGSVSSLVKQGWQGCAGQPRAHPTPRRCPLYISTLAAKSQRPGRGPRTSVSVRRPVAMATPLHLVTSRDGLWTPPLVTPGIPRPKAHSPSQASAPPPPPIPPGAPSRKAGLTVSAAQMPSSAHFAAGEREAQRGWGPPQGGGAPSPPRPPDSSTRAPRLAEPSMAAAGGGKGTGDGSGGRGGRPRQRHERQHFARDRALPLEMPSFVLHF